MWERRGAERIEGLDETSPFNELCLDTRRATPLIGLALRIVSGANGYVVGRSDLKLWSVSDQHYVTENSNGHRRKPGNKRPTLNLCMEVLAWNFAMKIKHTKKDIAPVSTQPPDVIQRSMVPKYFPGGPFTVKLLTRWASEGRGPTYNLIGNRAWYRRVDLEAIIAGDSDCVKTVSPELKAMRAARAELAREREKEARIAARSVGLARNAGSRRGRPSRAEVEARLALA
jgi:hypothetical protein